MDIMDGADLVLDMTIYDDGSSPYTPPPRIRTPKEPEEKEFKSPRPVTYNPWCLLLAAIITCSSVFCLLIGTIQLLAFNIEGFYTLGTCIFCFLFYHCLEAASLVPNLSKI
jgi:hypothetical protein